VPSDANRRTRAGSAARPPGAAASKGGKTRRAATKLSVAAAEHRAHRPAKRRVNRRVRGEGEGVRRPPLDPMERKVRNRTVLLLTLLALVNAYVFVWREGTSVLDLGGLQPTVIGAPTGGDDGPSGPLGSHADPPERACGGDPVRIFEGLHDQIFQASTLGSGRTPFGAACTRPRTLPGSTRIATGGTSSVRTPRESMRSEKPRPCARKSR